MALCSPPSPRASAGRREGSDAVQRPSISTPAKVFATGASRPTRSPPLESQARLEMADQRVRAILFDLDNTLLLEDESTDQALREAAATVARRTAANVDVIVAAAREAADEVFRAS